MKQVLLKKGTIYTAEVSKPQLEKDMVLVKTEYSCISAGTEMSGVTNSGTPLVKRVIESPELFERGMKMLKERGIHDTWAVVKGKYEVGAPMGYSASGVVTESGTPMFQPGDRVACMGVGYANHAGYLAVPKNLCVKIPANVSSEHASTAALGCIAMQGVRRADVKLGEFIVITGMGILGQLCCRFAAASGATVIATDYDRRRLDIAAENGAGYAIHAGSNVIEEVKAITGGYGADSVIVTAATNSHELMSQSFQMCRRKGKVVLVGVAGMNLKREDMYQKELELLISTSYGPGRYDPSYEEAGIDYPYGYVRFTERRNLESYLRLMSEGKINISDMVERVFPAGEADQAYEALKAEQDRPLIVLLKYSEDTEEKAETVKPGGYNRPESVINVALCGAGGFAKGMHLPNMQKMQDKYRLYAVQSRTGSNAEAIAVKNQAEYSTTDYNKILNDPNIHMVMICTRHHLHAKMAVEAMRAGKAVFVEKPMALTMEELEMVSKAAEETGTPYMVGFNRRFSRYAAQAKQAVKDRKNPLLISYRMNAGYIPLEHWTQGEEGGGRIVGEGCHIIDLFSYFTDSEAESVSVNRISPATDHVSPQDNCVISVKYKDGSVCTLTYTGQGSKEYGKEYCEIFFDGKTIVIDDYKSMSGYGVKGKEIKTPGPEKGQFEELEAFYDSIMKGDGYPIPLWQLEQATRISLMAQEN